MAQSIRKQTASNEPQMSRQFIWRLVTRLILLLLLVTAVLSQTPKKKIVSADPNCLVGMYYCGGFCMPDPCASTNVMTPGGPQPLRPGEKPGGAPPKGGK